MVTEFADAAVIDEVLLAGVSGEETAFVLIVFAEASSGALADVIATEGVDSIDGVVELVEGFAEISPAGSL